MTNESKHPWIVHILILTIIIDIMGVGLVFPIMPALFFGDTTVFVLGSTHMQNWGYAIGLAAWPLGLILGGPILGELSDKFGRKKILLIALFLTAGAYAISGFSIYVGSYVIFVLSRLMSGIVGGAFEIAQATVIDASTKQNKARNLGFIAMAASLGFMIGPIITSITTNAYFGWSITTPFWFAMAISFINALCILFLMKWDRAKHPELAIKLSSLLKTVTFLLTDKRVVFIGIIYLFMQCGWGFFGQGIALFLDQMYGYSTSTIGIFYAMTGLSVALCSIFIQPKIFKRFSVGSAYIVFAFICGGGLILISLLENSIYQWIIGSVASAAQLICYTALLTIISSSVSEKEQGKAMGGAGAGFGLAWFINDIMMGGLTSISVKLPIAVGGVFLFVSLLLVTLYLLRRQSRI